MSARTRRRLAAASFGPEWEPFGSMARWVLATTLPRHRPRMSAYMRQVRREYRWEGR